MQSDKIIETLVLWNFWEKDLQTGIQRGRYLNKIARYLKTDEIVALTGVRRSGKSTILIQVLEDLIKKDIPRKNTVYVNFEDPKFYNHLDLNLLDDLWEAYHQYLKPEGKVYLVLDEVQKIYGWEHWVRTKYDQKENIKIFVTGSNADFLASEFSSVLTGRHFSLSVTPLDFTEFLTFKGVKLSHDPYWMTKNKKKLNRMTGEYLQIGGFPKVVLTEDEILRKELLTQYFHDILTKDIVERHKLKDIGKLKSLALFYGTNFTKKYNFHKVKNVAEFSLSLDSIQKFSHHLESSFLVEFLARFSYSLRNQMQTDRKVYFVDNGMHNAIAFKFSSDKGELLENTVFRHLKARDLDVYYFSEKKEVDFVCKEGLTVKALYNVCYSLDDKETRLRETSALVEGMKYFKLKHAHIIVAEGEKEEISEKELTISVVPFYEWALSG